MALVLDANILVSFVLGRRVREILQEHGSDHEWVAPTHAFEEAKNVLDRVHAAKGLDAAVALAALLELTEVVQRIEQTVYESFKQTARQRLATSDEGDWRVLAAALALDGEIWSEDRDFFGTGVPTWISRNLAVALADFDAKLGR